MAEDSPISAEDFQSPRVENLCEKMAHLSLHDGSATQDKPNSRKKTLLHLFGLDGKYGNKEELQQVTSAGDEGGCVPTAAAKKVHEVDEATPVVEDAVGGRDDTKENQDLKAQGEAEDFKDAPPGRVMVEEMEMTMMGDLEAPDKGASTGDSPPSESEPGMGSSQPCNTQVGEKETACASAEYTLEAGKEKEMLGDRDSRNK